MTSPAYGGAGPSLLSTNRSGRRSSAAYEPPVLGPLTPRLRVATPMFHAGACPRARDWMGPYHPGIVALVTLVIAGSFTDIF